MNVGNTMNLEILLLLMKIAGMCFRLMVITHFLWLKDQGLIETCQSEESGSTGDGSYGQAKTSATADRINLFLFIYMLISVLLWYLFPQITIYKLKSLYSIKMLQTQTLLLK